MKIMLDQAYGSHPRQKLDIFAPSKSTEKQPVIVFWHGGSWKSGDKSRYHFVGRQLAKMGYVAVLPNYRLYPDVRYPDFLHDGVGALAWVQGNVATYGGDPDYLFLAGHSAGAYNAAMIALDPRLKAKPARGFIGLSGPYNFYPRPDLRPIFPLSAPKEHWLPIDHVNAATPPSLLIHGRLDWTVNYKNSLSLSRKLAAMDRQSQLIIYPHLEHMGTVAPFLPGMSWLAPVRRHVREFISRNI